MKVVLFCGGLGMRMRADNQSLPKPMMPIGSRPVLWHIMRYFAHFGHTEFILCLGHGANAVKDYFLDYRETASNDFVLTKGGQHVDMLSTDISDWTITFIDTGMDTPIGERLRRVRPYLEGDEYFLANYGDVLTDAPMNDLIDQFDQTDAVAQFIAVKPGDSFHVVETDDDGQGDRPGARRRPAVPHQRRLLRPAPGDLRLPRRGRRPGHGRLREGGQGRQDPRGPLRRLLGAHGHPQGADPPRGPLPPRLQSRGRCGGTSPTRAGRRSSRSTCPLPAEGPTSATA